MKYIDEYRERKSSKKPNFQVRNIATQAVGIDGSLWWSNTYAHALRHRRDVAEENGDGTRPRLPQSA